MRPAGYARHVTGLLEPPLPGTPGLTTPLPNPPKKLLLTNAWLDKQVSNQVTESLVRTLGIPNLTGSLQAGLRQIPDVDPGAAGVDNGFVMYDTDSFDVFDPVFAPFIPELANTIPSPVCDPHGRRFQIPASLDQLTNFLQPVPDPPVPGVGKILNFCADGVCDSSDVSEKPPTPCDPLVP